ncbi:hypothetical protein BZA70DRAFT_266569 [Myxozyma melibiosi]|uniref:Uncharacterized protein n=1 Tax=Myxozyma melibiosi TaxID=54550 RepID=A0ABR1FAV0_9ASCO
MLLEVLKPLESWEIDMARESKVQVLTENAKVSELPAVKREWRFGDRSRIEQCYDHVDSSFESELCRRLICDLEAVEFLEAILSAQFPEAFTPTPSQLNMLFTMISHPLFAGMSNAQRKQLSADVVPLSELEMKFKPDPSLVYTPIAETSTRVFVKLLSTGLSIHELGFHEALDVGREGIVEATSPPRRQRKARYNKSYDDDLFGSPQKPSKRNSDDAALAEFAPPGTAKRGRKNNGSSNKQKMLEDSEGNDIFSGPKIKSLWASVDEDILRILGWGFKCSSAFAARERDSKVRSTGDLSKSLEGRWPAYRNLIEILVGILERDWKETLDEVKEDNDGEELLYDSLLFKLLRYKTSGLRSIRWKSALSAVFATNSAGESQQYREIFSKEIEAKASATTLERANYALFLGEDSYPFGDLDSLSLRKRTLGLLFDIAAATTDTVDQWSWFMEMSSYLRDVSLQTLTYFLDPPRLLIGKKSEYVCNLCEALLQPLVTYSRLPKDWIEDFERGKVYISEFLALQPKQTTSDDYTRLAESTIKVAILVETLFRTWVKERMSNAGTRPEVASEGSAQQLDPGTDRLSESLQSGIAGRRHLLERARRLSAYREDKRWGRLSAALAGSEARLVLTMQSLEEHEAQERLRS